jgi:hypothetical protein
MKFIHTARSSFSLRPSLCAQVSEPQERYYRENTEESDKHSSKRRAFFYDWIWRKKQSFQLGL